jgi:hypothetical protein
MAGLGVEKKIGCVKILLFIIAISDYSEIYQRFRGSAPPLWHPGFRIEVGLDFWIILDLAAGWQGLAIATTINDKKWHMVDKPFKNEIFHVSGEIEAYYS